VKSRGKQKLRELFNKGLERLGLFETDLKSLPGSDPFTNGTTTPQGWTAERLQMKSAVNVSQQLSRAKKAKESRRCH